MKLLRIQSDMGGLWTSPCKCCWANTRLVCLCGKLTVLVQCNRAAQLVSDYHSTIYGSIAPSVATCMFGDGPPECKAPPPHRDVSLL